MVPGLGMSPLASLKLCKQRVSKTIGLFGRAGFELTGITPNLVVSD
jgi:hypothetical protein